MIIINSKEFHIEEPCAVAIGKFDGIHVGHMAIFRELFKYVEKVNRECDSEDDVSLCHGERLKTAVFTFSPSAARFFGQMKADSLKKDTSGGPADADDKAWKDEEFKEITTLAEKRIIFEKMGIDYLVEYPLDMETASIPPRDFVMDILIGQMNMKFLTAGEDLSFGHKGAGKADLMVELSKEAGFEAKIIKKVTFEGRDISSTYLREEIQRGHMEKVAKMLGHPYSFAGVVERGFRLGRTLGFPTMNLYPVEEKILPPLGVYYSEVEFEGLVYRGLTNIGCRPTVANPGDKHISVETYLYDFDMDMYGKNIITRLLKFKRPEIKFSSKEELKKQIEMDLEDGFFGLPVNDDRKFEL